MRKAESIGVLCGSQTLPRRNITRPPISPFSTLKHGLQSVSGKAKKSRNIEPDYEEVGPATHKNVNSGKDMNWHHCDLCGSLEGAVKCNKCNNQVFCFACDDMYHRHPKRSSHVRKAVDGHNPNAGRNVRPPIPPKADNQTPAPLPPPRKNKRFGSREHLADAGGTGRNIMSSLKKFMGTRPLPPPPDKTRGSLYKAGSTGNLAQPSSYIDDQRSQNMSLQVAIPQSIIDASSAPASGASRTLPPTSAGISQFPRVQTRPPHLGHNRKLSLQQFPPALGNRGAESVQPPNDNWETPPKIPQKMRSQSISDDQWNRAILMPGHNHPAIGYPCSGAASEAGAAASRRGYNTLGSTGRPGKYPGIASSASVTDLNVVPHGYPGMHSANSFQQLSMMGYDPNMMWHPCQMCQPPSMYPNQVPSSGMKRATSNVSMNQSTVGSDASGYPWSAPAHMHQHHHMPMYPGYFPGMHPHMMPHVSMRGSSGSIPDSVNSYNKSSSAASFRSSSRRSHKSSKSRSFNAPDINGRRSKGHSRRQSVDSNDSNLSSGSDEHHDLHLKPTKAGSLSWQCHHCTFINPGHARTCGMCSKSAPPVEAKTTREDRLPKTNRKERSRKFSNDDGNANVSDYDNDRRDSTKLSRQDSRSRASSSIRSYGMRSRNKSRPRDNSGSDSCSDIGARDDIERQLASLRLGSTSRMSGADRTSINYHARNATQPKREDGRRKRRRSRSQSLRPKTMATQSPAAQLSLHSSDEFINDFSPPESPIELEEPEPKMSSQEGTLVGTLSSVRKLSDIEPRPATHLTRKHSKDISSTTPDRHMYEVEYIEPENEFLQIAYHDELAPEVLKSRKPELIVQEKDVPTDLDDPSFANTLDDVDTMATHELAESSHNTRPQHSYAASHHAAALMQDKVEDENVFLDTLVQKPMVDNSLRRNEKTRSQKLRKRSDVKLRPPIKQTTSHYEPISQPLRDEPLHRKELSIPDNSHNIYRDESFYTASELDQAYEDELRTRPKPSYIQKATNQRPVKQVPPKLPERQQSPLSISSSEALFYSPPDTPDHLIEDIQSSQYVQNDVQLRKIEPKRMVAEFPASRRRLSKSVSDQAIAGGVMTATEMNQRMNTKNEQKTNQNNMTINEMVTKRKQDTMREQGLEIVQLLRDAEDIGYNPDDVSIAMTLSGEKDPLEWLKENWRHMVDTVTTLATNYSRQHDMPETSTISSLEAKDALRHHKGNIWAAVTECVEQRQDKGPSIERDGPGGVGKVQRISSFLKQMWTSPQEIKTEQRPSTIDFAEELSPKYEDTSDALYADVAPPCHKNLGETFSASKSISNELKNKIVAAMMNPSTEAGREQFDTDEDLGEYSEEEESRINDDEVIHDEELQEESCTQSEGNSESDYEPHGEFLSIADFESGHEGSIEESEDSGSSTPPLIEEEPESPQVQRKIKLPMKQPNVTVKAQSNTNLPSTKSPIPVSSGQRQPIEKKDPQKSIKVLGRYKPPASNPTTISKWKSIEFQEEPGALPAQNIATGTWKEEETIEADHVIKGSLTVKTTSLPGAPRHSSDDFIEAELSDEPMSITTGRLSLSLTTSESKQASVSVEELAAPTNVVETEEKIEIILPTIEAQIPADDLMVEPSYEAEKKDITDEVVAPESLPTLGEPKQVQKATKIVALAISKAMARESTVKEANKRDSMGSEDGSNIGSPLPPSTMSDIDEAPIVELEVTDESDSEDELGSLDTIPEEDEPSDRTQSGRVSKSSSKNVKVHQKSESVPAKTRNELTVPEIQKKKIVIPPAVESFSGPIFIPSSSSGRILLPNQPKINNKKSTGASNEHVPESHVTIVSQNTFVEDNNLAIGQTLSATSTPEPPIRTTSTGIIEKHTVPPANLEQATSSKPMTGTTSSEHEAKSIGSSSSMRERKSKDGGSTMVSSSESEEENQIEDVTSKRAAQGVTDEDFNEVKKLEEQINQMRKEIEARMSPTNKDDAESEESEAEMPIPTQEPAPEEVKEKKPRTMEERQQYEQLQFDRTVRRLLAEGQAKNYEKAELAAQLVSMSFDEDESIVAAAECSSIYTAMRFLRQECELCAEPYPMGKMVSMLHCVHRCCYQCANNYFTFQIKTKSIRELKCPFCNEPDLSSNEEVAMEYFNNLDILLKGFVDTETHELFQRKVRDFTLMKDPNFRWCNRCSSGFIANTRARKLFCPDCQEVTCAQCNQVWEPQHEGISCEEFRHWQEENDPESQALGVAKHLADCGITCPTCKFTYALAKGGCMHFTCTECKYEFCSGCSQPFKQGAKCSVGPYCERLGLHAHHPRNCLFYLRDKEPENLQQLLTEHNIVFDTESPYETVTKKGLAHTCRVMEQKESADGALSDDFCGRDVTEGHAGLCNLHYTEYLVEKINTHDLDPVTIFDEADLRVCLRRNGKTVPVRRWETEKLYRNKLIKLIKQQLPLS